MLPEITVARLFKEREPFGLLLLLGSERRIFYWEAETIEQPNDLADYSLGSATALATAGTGWSEITDSQGRYHLEPENEKVVYHCFFGVSPGQAWIYRRYPANKDFNSLLGTRAIGSGIGHIDGVKSPYQTPTPVSEFFTMKGQHPSFLGYHPFGEPSSITVRLYFYVTRYDVKFLGVDPSGDAEKDDKRVIAPEGVRSRAPIRTVGGHELVPVSTWIETMLRK